MTPHERRWKKELKRRRLRKIIARHGQRHHEPKKEKPVVAVVPAPKPTPDRACSGKLQCAIKAVKRLFRRKV